MSVISDYLVQPASLFMAAALLLGAVFERLPPGRTRNLAIGLVCGAAAALLIALSPAAASHGDALAPLVLVGAFVGGPFAVAGLLPAPLATLLMADDPGAPAACANLIIIALAGLGASCARGAAAPLRRTDILWLALLSPLAFIAGASLAPGLQADPFSLWLPIGTLLFGLAVVTEHSRGEAKRIDRIELRFRELTDTISVPLFQSQLEQHFRMHLRYGHEYSFMLVSIDDAAALRKALPAAEWELVRAAVAAHVRRSVRDLDVCAALEFDRFGVILPHASLSFALPVAERVQKAVATALGELAGDVTVSIGVAEVDGTTQPQDIEKAAEGELFLANMRKPKSAIGPVMDWTAAPTQPAHAHPGHEDAPLPAARDRRARPMRLVPLGDALAAHEEEDTVFQRCLA